MVEIVADIELVEVQWDDEGCECGRELGRADEGEREVWSVGGVSCVVVRF